MKVVLDTNVVVSGTFWTGTSFRILELVNQGKIRIITSLPILKEYDRVIHSEEILDKTTVYQQARIKATLKILNNNIIVEPKVKVDIVKDDPDDNMFIEAAVEGKAQYIISQDSHLLNIRDYKGIS